MKPSFFLSFTFFFLTVLAQAQDVQHFTFTDSGEALTKVNS